MAFSGFCWGFAGFSVFSRKVHGRVKVTEIPMVKHHESRKAYPYDLADDMGSNMSSKIVIKCLVL